MIDRHGGSAPRCGCAMGRRSLLRGMGAAGGLGLTAIGTGARAAGGTGWIDVHHHLVPPAWLDAMNAAKLGSPPLTNWTPEHSLDDMDRGGVATSMLSPTTPQVSFLDAPTAAKVARESNEWARKLADDHPGRFGVWAMLPMPHVDACLKEIEYALDTLKADGIGMMTSYGDKWLGYPEFGPVFDELNRRKAVVYTHPTTANCCGNLVQGIPEIVVEWGVDTTRTIANLIFSGASQRYGDVTFIFSHGGGVLAAVAERFDIQMTRQPYRSNAAPTREIIAHELNRFYYDTAQIANDVTIGALAKLVPPTQIVLGTDYPYRSSEEHTKALSAQFSGATLAALQRGNVERFVPRLRTG